MSISMWYKTCPFCDHQGRLFLYKNLDANKLYLHCEECERGYYDPNQINVLNSFLTLTEEFEAEAASLEDLKKHHWDHLEINIKE